MVQYAEIDGKEYKINTDYRVAISCFNAINDSDLTDIERTLVVIGLLFQNYEEIQNYEKALEIAKKYLTCNVESKPNDDKKDMDFEHDKDYINASFMSDYHIDIENTDMHWWQYFSLLKGLTEKCILNRVRDIRNYDLKEIKDEKFKQKMIEAKERVALPKNINEEDKQVIDEFNNLFK